MPSLAHAGGDPVRMQPGGVLTEDTESGNFLDGSEWRPTALEVGNMFSFLVGTLVPSGLSPELLA